MTNVAWYQDTSSKFNTLDDTNLGFKARKQLIAESKPVNLLGYLHCPLFNVDRLIINGVDMNVKLIPSKSNFQFIGDVNVKLHILDAVLKVRKVKIAPSVLIAHAKALTIANAKYPITRVEVM